MSEAVRAVMTVGGMELTKSPAMPVRKKLNGMKQQMMMMVAAKTEGKSSLTLSVAASARSNPKSSFST
jgi:hypothetical protein